LWAGDGERESFCAGEGLGGEVSNVLGIKHILSNGFNNRKKFDFVVGFTGMAILAKAVASPLQQLAREVFVNGETAWRATLGAFGGYGRTRVLLHTPVCVVFREKKSIEARVLRYSHPQSHPWGVLFTTCPSNTNCRPLPGDLRWMAEKQEKVHDTIKVWCARCGHKVRDWVIRPSWIHDCDTRYLPHLFWTNHPLTKEQREYMSSL
jgi:hypothetical protein